LSGDYCCWCTKKFRFLQGFGLAVAQELVEGMKGKIWLESEVGKGTIFFFTIPKSDGEQK